MSRLLVIEISGDVLGGSSRPNLYADGQYLRRSAFSTAKNRMLQITNPDRVGSRFRSLVEEFS
jgi:hypothetical protein